LDTNLLLEKYEQFNYVVEQMLINAQKENWEELISWQAKYQQLTQDIQLNDSLTIIDNIPLPQQEIIRIYINNILSYQQQLGQLIHERHSELSKLIGKQVDYQTKIDSYQKIANLA
jgi:hypothetical protein